MITRDLLTKYRKMAYRMIVDNVVAWSASGSADPENMKSIFKENFPVDYSEDDFDIVLNTIIRKLASRAIETK